MCVAKIDIKINQDWTPLINKFLNLKKVIGSTEVKSTYIEGFGENLYSFGDNGALIFYNQISVEKNTTGQLSGRMVENMLPWSKQLKTDLFGLNMASMGIQGNWDNITEHNDGQVDSAINAHCKLNYAISTTDAMTYARNGNEIFSYPTIKDHAYLIDTTKNHWVECKGVRFIFQIAFHESWETVYDWFSKHPGLRYGAE